MFKMSRNLFWLDSIYEGGLVGLLLGLAAHLADGGRHGVVVGARTTLPLVYNKRILTANIVSRPKKNYREL